MFLAISVSPGPVVSIPDDTTPGFPESSTPWVDDDFRLHVTSTTGANFVLSNTPAVVDSVYDWSTGVFEVESVCPIPESSVFGLSGSIMTKRDTALVVAPSVGLIDVDPVTCDYEVVATGFLPPIDIGGGQLAPGLANDVIADWQGNVYVSDSLFGTLYKWDGVGDIQFLAATPEMGRVDPHGVCQMPPALSFAPFFGINGLRLSRFGGKVYFTHTLPRGGVFSYDLGSGAVDEVIDLGCDVAPDELAVLLNGDLLATLAFDVVLDEQFALQSLGTIAEIDVSSGTVAEKVAGPFTFDGGEARTFGGPAAIHCLQFPLSGQCVVANHYAAQVGQPFEAFWFSLDALTWPEARPE